MDITEDGVRTAHHGSSGAAVRILESSVIKSGGPRVSQQGLWLYAHSSIASLPHVFRVEAEYYEMERLEERHAGFVMSDHAQAVAGLWANEPEVTFELDMHQHKISALLTAHAPDLYDTVMVRSDSLPWDHLKRGLTHGDPTVENVMRHPVRDHLVLIDPIPATPAVPDLVSVDLGKMLQSAIGWESVRYDLPYKPSLTSSLAGLRHVMRELPVVDSAAAWYWCVVHLLRALPYVQHDKEVTQRVLDLATAATHRL